MRDEEITLWRAATMMLRHWRLAVVVFLAVAVFGVGRIILRGGARSYTSNASFLPQGSGSAPKNSALAGLVAQYGVAVPGGEQAQSPAFYADLLRSRRILSRVTVANYTVSNFAGGRSVTLLEYFFPDEPSVELARHEAIRALQDRLSVDVNRMTGVVTFSVSAPEPDLARQIAAQIVVELRNYDLTTRQSNAGAERRFVESRLRDERQRLQDVEAAMEQFMARNRQFQSSAELRLAHQRLQRDYDLRQQVVTSLTQAYEQARIDEVRNTPVFSMIESPERPVGPDRRGRARSGGIVLIVGLLLAIAAAFAAAMLDRSRSTDAAAYAEFKGQIREIGHRMKLRHLQRAN